MRDVSEPWETEVAHWVARMDAADWTMDDERDLNVWLGEDVHRIGALAHAQAAWLAMDKAYNPSVAQVGPATVLRLVPPVDSPAVPVRAALWRRRSIVTGALAAAAIGMVGARRFFEQGQAFSTKLGEIRRVPLTDGSVMMINSGTSLNVTMLEQARQINLAQGEAWFQVAKDVQRPFVVSSGLARAQAVGTAFAVRTHETGVEVSVTEGVVQAWLDHGEAQPLRLVAGERAILTRDSILRIQADDALVEKALAWRSGQIDLSGMTLVQAAEEFNRYNKRQIEITDPQVAAERIDGLFAINDPDGFIAAIAGSLDVEVDKSGADVIVIRKGKA